MDRLLESSQFRGSNSSQSLLKFVVEATLAKAPETIRERNIGMQVFQREPGYDTNQDSIVRTTVVEVRKRLGRRKRLQILEVAIYIDGAFSVDQWEQGWVTGLLVEKGMQFFWKESGRKGMRERERTLQIQRR